MDNDKVFIRQYAAEIAQALREQEESPRGRHEESTAELYRALCFDEPIIEDIPNLTTAASALSRQLTLVASPFALSNRLVNGIVYLCQQRSTNPTKELTSTIATNPTTALALAKLAFSVLVQVPLECCQHLHTKNASTLQKYLGSYRGLVLEISREHLTESGQTDHRVNQLVESLAGIGTEPITTESGNDANYLKDEASLQEVWAMESDPSDYDFGDGDRVTEISQFPQLEEIDDLLDPTVLSKSDPQLTLEDARTAIGSLLQQANYSLFEPLFRQPKKQVENCISQLTQLILLLLQPPQSILLPTEDASSTPLQDAMLSPLWILRDVALHHPSTEHSFYTSSYMEVLQTLLAMDQAYLSDTKCKQQQQQQQGQNPLCSASIVGLSALSSWCCSAQISVATTTTAILDSMNDLAHVMERASENGYKENLKHTMTPILELLTGISYQAYQNRNSVTSSGTMIPQAILNSGLLRQLLMLSLDDQGAILPPPFFLDHAIWGLCIAYPTVVGKYVARFPGFPIIVRRYRPNLSDLTTSMDCVHSILWNCFVAEHGCEGSQISPILWKNKANGAPPVTPLTKEECREVCQKSWAHLCEMVQSSVETSSSSLVSSSSLSSPKQGLKVVQDWERLFKFVSAPSVAVAFQSLITDYDLHLASIGKSLAHCTSDLETDSSADIRSKNEKPDDEDEDDRKKTSMINQQLVVATTRKMLKQYTLFFQGNGRSSSKTD